MCLYTHLHVRHAVRVHCVPRYLTGRGVYTCRSRSHPAAPSTAPRSVCSLPRAFPCKIHTVCILQGDACSLTGIAVADAYEPPLFVGLVDVGAVYGAQVEKHDVAPHSRDGTDAQQSRQVITTAHEALICWGFLLVERATSSLLFALSNKGLFSFNNISPCGRYIEYT